MPKAHHTADSQNLRCDCQAKRKSFDKKDQKIYYVTTVLVILIELANRIGLLGCFKINHEDEIVICHHFYGKFIFQF